MNRQMPVIEANEFLIVLIYVVGYNCDIEQIIQNAARADERAAAAVRYLQMNLKGKNSHV